VTKPPIFQAINCQYNPPYNADYGYKMLAIGGKYAYYMVSAEKESIAQRDVFGKRVMECAEKQGSDPEPVSPFVEYLRQGIRYRVHKGYSGRV